ncbi:hypothetical protein F0562_034801 [Nyssa sinensis]|uniref:Uncharacterized protein n=1 Tax=Nyssa sinensis TaxID=561372 RepID=A0A5J5AB65_9ASTE|nr:hypothetical protein F0562_034801 [Nyssa sinensis]
MGCGESKHDVVTGNTVSQSKRSNSDAENNKDTETISEKATNDHTNTTNSSAQQEETENAKEDSIKLISKDGGDVEEKEEEPGRLMSRDSPGHFFSSRKDEETIESIISEGMSGKSEYYSPRTKEAVSKGNEKLDDACGGERTREPTKVNEENSDREAEVMPTIELKDSATGGDEKAGANEEHLTDSSTKDSKSTN